MTPGIGPLVGLLGWGTVVGLDLVTVPQGLLSRPLVAATGAGLMLGNVPAGLLAGMTLELYALDVLPIGAVKYPDFGIAAVAGGAAAALGPLALAPGLAGLVGLPVALLGGWTLLQLRRRNAVSVQRRLERVAAGDALAIWELQRNGFLRDAARSAAVTVVGVVVALLVASVKWESLLHAQLLSWATIAGGLTAALGGAARSAGAGARGNWLAIGLVLGMIVVLAQ